MRVAVSLPRVPCEPDLPMNRRELSGCRRSIRVEQLRDRRKQLRRRERLRQ
jgi:hypothetical protein